MNNAAKDERLRHLLRQTDPAADDPGLSREEIRAMRRTVLSAIPEPRRRWALASLLMAAATALLVLVLGWTIWLGGFSTAPARQPLQAAVPKKSPLPSAPVRPAVPMLRVTAERPAAPAATRHHRRPAKPRQPAAPKTFSPEPVAIAEAETHQIQFSTPGGTRIIWVLTSDKTAD